MALAAVIALPAAATTLFPPANCGIVFDDGNGNGQREPGESGLAGVLVSDGHELVRTGADGRYVLKVIDGRTTFVIKPAGWRLGTGADGLPDFWRNIQVGAGPALKFGGVAPAFPRCRDFALQRDPRQPGELRALLFGDPQPKSAVQVGYYERDIIDAVRARYAALPANRAEPAVYRPELAGELGLSLGDIVDDDLALYPAMIRATARLQLPWLHVAGNHDLDFDAGRDEDSLATFRRHFGPDTLAWEEHEASFVLLDDVIYRPGQQPAYIGGLREDQFEFLQAYLPTLPRDRMLVLAAHIPFFDPAPGRETFRRGDRERLFALLRDFPKLLLLSAHGHVQRRHLHGPADGWLGAAPLHEINLGATCGAYWSGVKDARGLPDATMPDGTPNGWARLVLARDGGWTLRWENASDPADPGLSLHAPRVLRQGAYPAYGIYANVYLALPDARVEFRIGEGPWRPMQRVERADPRVLRENALDDAAPALRGFDRSPEAVPSTHLWRATLPTDLAIGEHRIEVRSRDAAQGEISATTTYRLVAAGE